MRGESNRQQALFSYVSIEERIPTEHPIRRVKLLCDQVLRKLSEMFEGMYSELGRPSIPPERLLKSQVLMALYSVRSDRMFCERLNWDMLFRWFLEMSLDEPGFDATSFTKNRNRLLEHDIGRESMVEKSRTAGLFARGETPSRRFRPPLKKPQRGFFSIVLKSGLPGFFPL